MSTLTAWAERVLKEVDQDGGHTKKIQLVTDGGQVWETWDAPFPSVTEWVEQAEAMLDSMKGEFPVRRVQAIFTASDSNGAVRAQQLKSFQGTNKDAGALVGSNGSAKAFSESMEQMSRTMNVILKSAETHVATVTKSHESLANEFNLLVENVRQKNIAAALEAKIDSDSGGVDQWLAAQLKEFGPLAMKALEIMLENASKSSPASAAAAAVITNGKAVS